MDPEDFDRGIRKVVMMRLDALMFGVLAAYAQVRWAGLWKRMRWPAGVLGSVLLVLFYVNPNDWKGASPPLLFVWESLAVVAFLPLLSTWKQTGFRWVDRVIVFFSVVSYSLYLLHLTPVLHTLMPAVGADAGSVAGALGFYVGVSVLASAALYLGFERPTTAWRERWAPHGAERVNPPGPGPRPVR
jgi:peptidoglycan/LPS O-acetylase OafA/YrhL